MAKKRKRSSKDTTPRKRAREPHPHGEFDEDKEYKIRAIVDETKTRYQIEWEDDEVSGEQYPLSWEPKGFANKLAVEDWEETKKQRRSSSTHLEMK